MKKILMLSMACIMISLLVSCSTKESKKVNNDKATTTENDIIATEALAEPTESITEAPAEPTISPTEVPVAEIDYENAKLVALSFDDGPNTTTTTLVLDKLEEYGVTATFFLIGKNITDETKPIMERQLSLGCEINSHSWTHSNMSTFTEEQNKDEMQKTSDKIFETVGVYPSFFRPPYISTSSVLYQSIDLPFINGINCTDWDATVTAEKRSETILKNVKDGDIILLHDFAGNNNTVEALGTMIQGMLDDGFTFVTISQLFEYKGVDPNVENVIWSNVSK